MLSTWAQVTAAIVTCGGLCPGLNDVIANIVTTLEDYGVPDDRIYGIRYGLRGFVHRDSKPINLNRALVDGIHLSGGTLLVRYPSPSFFFFVFDFLLQALPWPQSLHL